MRLQPATLYGFAVAAYDATCAALTAYAKRAPGASLKATLLSIPAFEGVQQTWSFDAQGDATRQVSVARVHDGRFVALDADVVDVSSTELRQALRDGQATPHCSVPVREYCKVRGLWPRDLQRLGKTGPDQAPEVNLVERTIGQRSLNGPRTVRVPEGIDPGFEYAPGSARLRSAIPPERPDLPGSMGVPSLPTRRPTDPLPPPRAFPASGLLAAGDTDVYYAGAFLARFGAALDTPAIFTDVVGERLVVGKELFQTPDGRWKAMKRERHPFMQLLAQALIDPDEIWTRLEWMHALQKAVVRRRYIARFQVEGEETPALAVFEVGSDGWAGVTTFPGTGQSEADWRVGVNLYRRLQEDQE